MRPSALLLAGFLLPATSYAVQPATPTPRSGSAAIAVDNPGPGVAPPVILSDIAAAYDSTARTIEVMFAKLIQEDKNRKAALEDQIKKIDKSIESLKQEAKNVELVLQRVGEIDSRKPSTARLAAIKSEINTLEQQKKTLRDQIAALEKEIQKLEADKTKELAELRRQKQKALEAATKTLSQGASAAQLTALLDTITASLQQLFNELSTRYRAGATSSSAR